MTTTFIRSELRVMQNLSNGDNEAFLNAVTLLVDTMTKKHIDLEERFNMQTQCIRTMTVEASELIQERETLQRKVEQLQKKYNDFS